MTDAGLDARHLHQSFINGKTVCSMPFRLFIILLNRRKVKKRRINAHFREVRDGCLRCPADAAAFV
jgi:hypothetical protein